MKVKTQVVLPVVSMLLFGLAAQAQMAMGPHPPDVAGVFNPVVGSGGSYEVVKKDGQKMSFDMAVVDKDPSGGYWIEFGMQNPRMNGAMYMKSLMVRQADDVVIQRMIMQMPGRQPMEMTSMISMKGAQSQKADFRTEAENVGTESVTTPAGTFVCQHWRDKKDGTDVWISDKVAPWKLVKMTGPDNSMILVHTIADAKTHITGTPISMEDMMKGMGR
jgi:hypothetical protein